MRNVKVPRDRSYSTDKQLVAVLSLVTFFAATLIGLVFLL